MWFPSCLLEVPDAGGDKRFYRLSFEKIASVATCCPSR
jgi:hypothetical protein